MPALNKEQSQFFWEQGYLLIENAVTPELLKELQHEFAQWVEDSKRFTVPFGETINGGARFDLEASHKEDQPALRRVNAPIEISEFYHRAMVNSRMTDCVSELIGPNVKFHHSKINSKLPGSRTEVKWHQDFLFTPHSNDDVITALLMLDDVTQENGPLEVVPGTHRGKLYELWHGGVFTGTVEDEVEAEFKSNANICCGSAGSVCLMHTRLLHGSGANHSESPRTLFICVYSAEDAIPCSPNPMPSKYEGLLVRGKRTGKMRMIPLELKLPEKLTTASFFDQQEKHGTTLFPTSTNDPD